MNSTKIAIIIIVLVAVAGGAYLFTTSNSQPAVNDTTEIDQQEKVVDDTQMEVDADTVVIEVSGANFSFNPSKITVKKGQKVKVVFTANDMQHDFVIDELDVKSDTVTAGRTTEVEFTPTEAGEFEYYCSVGNHRAQGMVGTLTVTE
jgi:nitrite reductase (NO-forming)